MTLAYPAPRLYIDGEWTLASDGRTRPVINPADDSVLGALPIASDADIDRALASAQNGFEAWRGVPPIKRAEIINRAAQLLRERCDEITCIACLEEGQPFEEGKSYVMRAAEILEWDAAEGRRVYGRIVPSEPGLRLMVTREPIGVVAAFTPWNAPVFTPCRKIGSVLAAGCSLILKAAEETPASTAAVVRCFVDAGVPPGVVTLLYGDPAQISTRLIASPVVRLVTLTGSIHVGKHLAQLAAAEMKPSVMELGGHAPVIVCEDANVEDAARKLAFVKYRNAGQACLCPTRFWVADAVYDRFLATFTTEVSKLKVGSSFEPGVTMGPLANAKRLSAMQELVGDAVAQGARVVAGGERIGDRGCFFQPTVLADVPDAARILREEPFGPLAVINRYTDLEDVIGRANALPYGLAGYVFTRSANTAEMLSRRLECGTVGINHLTVSTSGIPFGGIKDSGYGREGGAEGVESYTVVKTLSHLFI
ncbi:MULTISPECIES: NAD-dependent succinate-semialdehyde dehydrogenase [Paraburkholderia]|uniref:NAD-dependent succinate-semialdehyde dehydrogenase n=1 Tax=Paraburkholderia TaxID=1822464 RepID=UPI001655BCCB|nr:NAD-dependent succinate-semialdehyde dehydrogenase [Paraburkholderia podalyriae]